MIDKKHSREGFLFYSFPLIPTYAQLAKEKTSKIKERERESFNRSIILFIIISIAASFFFSSL